MQDFLTGEPLGDDEAPEGTDAPGTASEFAGGPPEYVPDGQVQVAYCHSSRVSHSWHNSMMNMLAYDKVMGANLIASAPFQVACSGPHGLVEGRNLAVRHFLDETSHEWLFWVDTDMGFRPDSLDLLVAAAHPEDRAVVGGLCFALKQVQPDGYSGFVVKPLPTLFGLARDKEGNIGFLNRSVYPENSLVQVAGTGSAFILIHRSVLEQIRVKHSDNWYTPVAYENGQQISEDLSFCWKVGELNRSVFVHTGVKTTHHKELWVGADDYTMPDADPVFDAKRKARA